MNSNQLIIYNNPIKSVFNNFLTKVKAKFTAHKTFNREVEKQLQKEFTNKDELNYARKLLKEILSRNKLALETIDIRMLRKDKVDLFGKPTFERIINDKAIQEDILELSPQELQTYKYIMNYNTTDINEHLGRRINPYFCQINNISDLQALPVEQRIKAISILLSDTEFYLTDLSQLDQYYNKRKEIYQNVINKPEIIEEQLDKDSEEILSYFILTEMEELSYIDKLDDSQEKRIVQELKAILQENNIEKLRNINLNEDYRNYEGTLNIFSNLKNAYLRKYKETLYQLKDNDYIETQSTKIKGKKKNIRIYNI